MITSTEEAHLVILDTTPDQWASVGWSNKFRVFSLGDNAEDGTPEGDEYIALAQALLAVPEIRESIAAKQADDDLSAIAAKQAGTAHDEAWANATDGLDPETAALLCEREHGKSSYGAGTNTPGVVVLYRGSKVDRDIYQWTATGFVRISSDRPDMGGAGYGMNT